MHKSVRFSTEPKFIPTVQPSFEKWDVWYNRNEIEAFRTNAKAACQTFQEQKITTPFHRYSIVHDMISNNNIRGLELANDEERKKRKVCANKIIIEAQKSTKVTKLARLSSDLSKWTTDNAIKDARLDFLAVCHIYIN